NGAGPPGALRPEETEHLAMADVKGDVLERDPVAEALAQTVDGQRRGPTPLPIPLHGVRGCRPSRDHETLTLRTDLGLVPVGHRGQRPGRDRRAPQLPDEPPDQEDHHWYLR